jgi:uncharacterized coiled-coil protein SlyX
VKTPRIERIARERKDRLEGLIAHQRDVVKELKEQIVHEEMVLKEFRDEWQELERFLTDQKKLEYFDSKVQPWEGHYGEEDV